MSYSLDELFEDHIKGTDSLDELISKLANCARKDKVFDFIFKLLKEVTDEPNGRRAVLKLIYSDYAVDELYIITRVMGDLELVGKLPEGLELKLTPTLIQR